jgi:hypothetical protein
MHSEAGISRGRQKISSTTPFEFDGFWWLPGTDALEREAQGLFSWNPTKGVS